MIGEIVRHGGAKTAVVKVTMRKRHPKYRKQYPVSRRYKAHDEKNEYIVGDMVEIKESRPLSKGKRWIIIKKV